MTDEAAATTIYEGTYPIEVSAAPAGGLSLTVNTTNDTDDGACTTAHCSLREAINRANNEAGTDTISFDIPGAGPHTIQPASALPVVTEAIVIDGATEPDFAGSPVVEVDGQNAGAGVIGLVIAAGDSTVRGLVVNRFSQAGIALQTGDGNVVAGNYVGTDATGTLSRGNIVNGIEVQSWATGSAEQRRPTATWSRATTKMGSRLCVLAAARPPCTATWSSATTLGRTPQVRPLLPTRAGAS